MHASGPPMSAQESAYFLVNGSHDFVYSAALGTVAALGVADHLADGPRTAAELADATGCHGPFLRRVLRLVATRGAFHEDAAGRFALTPAGYALRSDAVPSVRDVVAMVTARAVWLPSSEMLAAVREGRPTFEQIFGKQFFEHLAADDRDAAAFHRGMANYSQFAGRLDVDTYDFPAAGVVVDVGGGQGVFLLEVLRANAGLRGVLFDQEYVLAEHRLGELGADDRWRVVSGDFFAEVPAGGDVYVLKLVLHDWSDEECVRILRNCRRAMAPDGRVLVVESIVPPGNEPHFAKVLDVIMLLNLTGRERTESEFAQLFAAAGLRLARVIPTAAVPSIIEAVAA
jgi:hypothetical protein